jgi:hypothetical protein
MLKDERESEKKRKGKAIGLINFSHVPITI